jgi:hypothetical protein
MPYIGKEPEHGNYQRIDTIASSFNGTLVTFNLRVDTVSVYPTSPTTMIISLGGVIQEPNAAYTVTGDTITFTTAPVANTTFWGVSLGDTLDIGTPSDEAVTEAKLAISNAGTNGQFLSKQSGNPGGLTWATPASNAFAFFIS